MLPLKPTRTQHLRFKIFIYLVLVGSIATTGWDTYKQWLNPLNMQVEENPKQHDGSQPFNPPRDFESSVQPLVEDGEATIYVSPDKLKDYTKGDEVEIDDVDVELEDDGLIDFPDIGLDN